MITSQQQEIIKAAVRKFNPTLVGVFGSYARSEQAVGSDLDILIDFDKKVNLLDIIGLEQELSEILGISIDLVTVKSVSEYLRPYIEKDLIRII